MQSYVLHGDNLKDSRSRLGILIQDAKKKDWEVVYIDWKKTDKVGLETAVQAQTLIAVGYLIVVENFFNNNKKALDTIEGLLIYKGAQLIFWEGRILTPATVKSLQENFKVEEFKTPVVVFNFLKSITPGNNKLALRLFHQALEKDEVEFLFIMLARHVRQLIWMKEDPQTLLLPPWLKSSLESQAGKFSENGLRALHHTLLDVDRKNKKSQLAENLEATLDLLVASI